MPLKNVVGFISGDIAIWRASYRFFLIDATGEKFASILKVPKTGTIDRLGFSTRFVTTPQTLRVGLETLSSGDPSGSQYGGSAVGTQASPASFTYYEVTLATPATAVAGDDVAIVVQFNATVGNLEIASGEKWGNQNFPYTDHYTGSWSKQGDHPVGHVRYSDGTYPNIGFIPAADMPYIGFNSGTTPDERALKFKLPVPARIRGIWARLGTGTGNFDIVLYDENGTTLATKSVVAANAFSTGNDPHRIIFNAPVSLRANKFYRISLKPTTTNNVELGAFTVNSASYLDSFNGGQNFHLSTRTDAGAWTDTTTNRPGIELLFDQLHDGENSDYAMT